jgi:plastocyanin
MRLRRFLIATLLPAAAIGPSVLLSGPAAAGAGTCHSTSLTTTRGDTVVMRDNCYWPTVLQAAPGDTITFVNRDAQPNSITGAGDWGTGFKDISKGDVFRVRLEESGLYLYACVVHPGMMGAVYVGKGDVKVADSDAAFMDSVDFAAEDDAASDTETKALETETASAAEGTGTPRTAGMVVVGAAALGAGYGLGRLRRRAPGGRAG